MTCTRCGKDCINFGPDPASWHLRQLMKVTLEMPYELLDELRDLGLKPGEARDWEDIAVQILQEHINKVGILPTVDTATTERAERMERTLLRTIEQQADLANGLGHLLVKVFLDVDLDGNGLMTFNVEFFRDDGEHTVHGCKSLQAANILANILAKSTFGWKPGPHQGEMASPKDTEPGEVANAKCEVIDGLDAAGIKDHLQRIALLLERLRATLVKDQNDVT